MKPLPLDPDKPYQLILCADARFTEIDFADDQVWELSLAVGEPPAITLCTNYGLRCHWIRLFPRFTMKDVSRNDPSSFHRYPFLEKIYPNWIVTRFEPFEGISVIAEYRAINSHCIAGRFSVSNLNILPQSIQLQLAALLNPIGSGESMLALQKGDIAYLRGITGSLTPCCVMSGNYSSVPAPYPALTQDLEIYPGGEMVITWALASLNNSEQSLEEALTILDRPWEAETARIEIMNQAQQVEIETGNPEWDAALRLSQVSAWSLFINKKVPQSNLSIVLARHPELRYSPRGDGSDFNYPLKGETALDIWYLSQILLPGGVLYLKKLVDKFFDAQKENGWIDWKSDNLGGKGSFLSAPLFATLALQLSPYFESQDWLKEIYPKLIRFIKNWFLPNVDQDQDGYPEWQSPLQTGLEESPMYNRWSKSSQGLEINWIESPSLAAFLIRELDSLIEIGRLIGEAKDIDWLRQRQKGVSMALRESWDEEKGLFHYRDAITHSQNSPDFIGEWSESGQFSISKDFKDPSRIIILLYTFDETSLVAHVLLHGSYQDDEVAEEILPYHFAWSHGRACASTKRLFSRINKVEIKGVRTGDSIRLATAGFDFEDCSLFLPLWSKSVSIEQSSRIIEQALKNRFWQPKGISICPIQNKDHDPPLLDCVSLLWNSFIFEGLNQCNEQQAQLDLMSAWLDCICLNLKENHMFHQFYHAIDGSPFGEKNHLYGLLPVNLFLKLAGIKHLSSNEILLEGNNRFPHPIHVKYKKLAVYCDQHEFIVEYPGGSRVTLRSPGPHRVIIS